MTNCDDHFPRIESAIVHRLHDGDINTVLDTVGEVQYAADPRIKELAAGLTTDEIEQCLLDFARRVGRGSDGEPANMRAQMQLTFICLAKSGGGPPRTGCRLSTGQGC